MFGQTAYVLRCTGIMHALILLQAIFLEGMACTTQNKTFSQHVFAFRSTAVGLYLTYMDLHIEQLWYAACIKFLIV
jgi:hypothetical protein